jgi:hypothetical protein
MRMDSGPADTRMMGIVHDALRRDLERMLSVLTTQPFPSGRQRRALGEHAVWLMDLLHTHHTTEDEGLWPLVRDRNPAAGPLLDSLDADHRRIEPAIPEVTAAGQRYAATTTDEARADLVGALEALMTVLLPHLDREVNEGMPVVSASITQVDWHSWDQKYNLRSKSLSQLGMEGHWVVDGIDPEALEYVKNAIPAVVRFILQVRFGRAYRRRAAARWTPGASRQPVPADR